jgi:undecaprenyl-diphosphatase
VDVEITRWINSFAGHDAVLDRLMVTATQFGIPLMVALVVLQWWGRENRTHLRHTAIVAGLSFLLGLGFNQLILLFFDRVRPYDAGITHLLVARSGDWSFPSDHATAAMAIAAAFMSKRLPWRTFGFSVCAVAICWSRIYVGTHYLTDVLGGAATGLIAAGSVTAIYREDSTLDRIATSIL